MLAPNHHLTLYSLAFISCLSNILAATVPTVASILNPPTELVAINQTILNAERPECEGGIPFSPFYLTLHKCAEAIHQLNASTDIGDFHHGDPFDAWSLPVSKYSDYCKVTVDMKNLGTEDRTSWLAISHAAAQLNVMCWGKFQYRYRGGRLSVGEKKGITIRLEYRNKYSQDGGPSIDQD